ncbi:OLC1v1019520C1 [Oldenlandia corymbosa var. corymbosa]|uniref:OLC1v1019520C1 n=1 Tax=Oldenlandia corymbosa var. corymbosa TaxID=529605 RepID=A0AAV1EEC5_OLDCO|nr:OLC1v1019520C1 [Oldenlandia corymbosa var. corymbosa]
MFCWIMTRSMLAVPRWRCISVRSPALNNNLHHRSFFTRPSPQLISESHPIFCVKDQKLSTKASEKVKLSSNDREEKDLSHILWWKEKMQLCRKPSSVSLVKRLMYNNLLGVDSNLKNGSLKEGNLNWEMMQFKSKFPREVLLCRVGDFYEAIGIDACILVEYAGLNPFGGLRSDSIPRAGCPVMNLRQTLDDLTRHGFSVCIVEEVQGPTQARGRKSRFIAGHAHPGSPYVFGLVEDDRDLDFPEPMPVVGTCISSFRTILVCLHPSGFTESFPFGIGSFSGISRSAKGYCLILVLETMKTYSVEDGLTEEALVAKLRTCQCHHLFLHSSLKSNSSGTCRWGEFGEGGLLWGECAGRHFEWFDGSPVNALLCKVMELYGMDEVVEFRNVTVASDNRPRPLYLGTATQIGAIQTEGIPSLLKVLVPPTCVGLPVQYIRGLLLNPPAYETAVTIQEICRLMNNVTCSIPEFTCFPPAKLVKLLELREANHVEFCKIKSVVDQILQMSTNLELNKILKLLMDPTWVATGLKIEFETLVNECELVSRRIGEIVSLDGETDQKISSFQNIPNEFFEDMEASWKGRVKRIHLEEEFLEVENASRALSLAVSEDFDPIITRIKASSDLSRAKGEVLYAREHGSVWFKGRRFEVRIPAGTPGEEQINKLKSALDSKGKKVGEEWYTTMKVEEALSRYHDAGAKAKLKVMDLLRELSSELQTKINILVFASMLLVISKALFSHVSEGRRRKWVFPSLTKISEPEDADSWKTDSRMKITGLSPYWFDVSQGRSVDNTVDMQSLFLLTGPNGGGKSSLLRSICAAALLGICGFMIPAQSAIIPHFDSITLHMKSYDSPADGKSSFQIEMSELRSIVAGATSKSLVLIDEICRGTETAKGTCIAGSIVETLDAIGCLGIVSTHLHGIFDLPLKTKNVVYKAMGSESVDGQTIPTWKLIDGICKESLAFETARREGIPENLIQRAEELYLSVYANRPILEKGINGVTSKDDVSISDKDTHLQSNIKKATPSKIQSANRIETLRKKVESAVSSICKKTLSELYEKEYSQEHPCLTCVLIGAREQPPPSTIGVSSVYVMLCPDSKIYIGQTDDLEGRIRAHRSKDGLQNASFLYFLVPGKSIACQLETLLINQLPERGFRLSNVADGKHRNFGTSTHSAESIMMLR